MMLTEKSSIALSFKNLRNVIIINIFLIFFHQAIFWFSIIPNPHIYFSWPLPLFENPPHFKFFLHTSLYAYFWKSYGADEDLEHNTLRQSKSLK